MLVVCRADGSAARPDIGRPERTLHDLIADKLNSEELCCPTETPFRFVEPANLWQGCVMLTKTIDLEVDAVEKLETAKWAPEESFSDLVRRAQFPQKAHLAPELLAEFQQRAGHSPLNGAACRAWPDLTSTTPFLERIRFSLSSTSS